MPNIVDVIGMKSQWSEQVHYYVVIDAPLNLRYERQGNTLLAEDDGFFDCLREDHGTSDSFGGRNLSWTMVDGSKITSHGHIWSVGHPRSKELTSIGVATLEELEHCYVFCMGSVLTSKLNEWLSRNPLTTDYHKYDKRRAFAMPIPNSLPVTRGTATREERMEAEGITEEDIYETMPDIGHFC